VETAALIDALSDGTLAGAGLDVLEDEPTRVDAAANATLRQFANVVITPHSAFYSDESVQEMRQKAAAEVKRVLSKQPARNCVNLSLLSKGYWWQQPSS